MNIYNKLLIVMAACSLNACIDLAPMFNKPEAPVPATLGNMDQDVQAFVNQEWQVFIRNTQLKQVIQLALEHNRDLKLSVLTIEKARALYQIQRADLFPTIAATGSEIAYQGNANTGLSAAGVNTGTSNGSNLGTTSNSSGKISHTYRATVGFSAYELDLFGRIKNLNEQALQSFYSNQELRKSTQISLIAEVATAWLTIGADKARLSVAQDTLDSQQKTYDINKRMLEIGVGNALTLQQLQTSVDTAKVAVATYKAQVRQDLNALNLLAGTSIPEALLPDRKLDMAALTQPLPTGISSEILQQRPDVKSAEHLLAGANANIGALRAAYFPTITLTTSVGSSSKNLQGLFDSGSGLWSFVPQVNVPIFNAGRISSNLEAAKKDQAILLAQYEKTVQTAFSEVANVLVQRESLQEQMTAQQSLLFASDQAFLLADMRFKNGIDNYLVVLDAQRTWYSAQQSMITLELTEATSQLTLYKVFGGGWH